MELVVDNLEKVFSSNGNRTDLTVFKNLNFHVSSGEFISIIGPSGCGKSTLLEIIAGNNGLGHLVEEARGTLSISTMFMVLFVLGALGYSLDWLVRFTEKKLMPWRKGKTISV